MVADARTSGSGPAQTRDEGWVTLVDCYELIQAQSYAAALRGAGIAVAVPDQHLFSNYPVLGFGSTGCRVWVRRKDAEEAAAIIRTTEAMPPAYPCPACGGPSRRLRSWIRTLAMTWVMMNFGPPGAYPFRRRKRLCESCRHRFDPQPPEPFTPDEIGYDFGLGPSVSESPLGAFRGVLKTLREFGIHKETPTVRSDP